MALNTGLRSGLISCSSTLSGAGYALSDGKCFPGSEISKRMSLPSCSPYEGRVLFQNTGALLSNFSLHILKRRSFTCKVVANNRKNPDFSRQSKGFSKGKSRRYQDKDNSENTEETDLLSSKNGPLLSLASNPRYQATAAPGQREKEIVELFRKVQKQLRERAAIKEEKKMEPLHQGQGEKGTVDSLLKLLRKHTVDQRKKTNMEDNVTHDHVEGSTLLDDDQNPNLFESNIGNAVDMHTVDTPLSRPSSNFRRKSPVPRVKFQPIYSAEESLNSNLSLKSQEQEKCSASDLDQEPTSFYERDEVLSDDLSDVSETEENYEVEGSSELENIDLSSLKLSELRDLAKSRGIRGYSKLKKGELVELLEGNGL